jgi:hypothetical protein
VQLKKDVAGVHMPYDGLTIRSFSDSLDYRGGFGFRPRLDRLENLAENAVRILKLVEFSLELTMFAIYGFKSRF